VGNEWQKAERKKERRKEFKREGYRILEGQEKRVYMSE
jgi:hypothetical protein